jgi:hypothetical protein
MKFDSLLLFNFQTFLTIIYCHVQFQAEEIPWAPGTIFSLMCLIVVVILFYLPETRGVELPQTLAEVELWYSDHSGLHRRHKSETTWL